LHATSDIVWFLIAHRNRKDFEHVYRRKRQWIDAPRERHGDELRRQHARLGQLDHRTVGMSWIGIDFDGLRGFNAAMWIFRGAAVRGCGKRYRDRDGQTQKRQANEGAFHIHSRLP
jgi:hypothetical protein